MSSDPLSHAILAAPVRALDRARWYGLKALGPLAKPLMTRRELRVALAGVGLTALALLGATVWPLWVLALGPIVWGTPHVLSDVRYLWVRPGRHRSIAMWIAIGIPLVVLSVTAHPAWGFAASIGAVLVARGSHLRRALVGLVALGLVAVALIDASHTTVVFAHVHNFVGVVLWLAWRPRRTRKHWLLVATFVAACALIVSGALDPLVLGLGGLDANPGGLSLWLHLGTLAPGMDGMVAVRLVLLFAFAQSVHYAVWVRLVPEEDRARETPRTYAATLRALRAEMGTFLVVATIVVALGVAVWAAYDVYEARNGYLRAVLFHGHLELAAIALLMIEGRRPRVETSSAA
ncbi:MAG: hypothetical protein AB7S26_06920 [Sandaracinaceae bacterium]